MVAGFSVKLFGYGISIWFTFISYLLITLQLFNYCSFEGVLYCKPHFDQLFKMTGSLDKSFEGAFQWLFIFYR